MALSSIKDSTERFGLFAWIEMFCIFIIEKPELIMIDFWPDK